MKIPGLFYKKILLGALLIFASALISMVMKQTIDSFDPENALPQISVSAGYTVPAVQRAGYEWDFLTTTKRSPVISSIDLPLVVLDVQPQVPIVINFSAPYKSIEVSRADGLYNEKFFAVSGEVVTPAIPGIYVYAVKANFSRGYIQYYFALEVRP